MTQEYPGTFLHVKSSTQMDVVVFDACRWSHSGILELLAASDYRETLQAQHLLTHWIDIKNSFFHPTLKKNKFSKMCSILFSFQASTTYNLQAFICTPNTQWKPERTRLVCPTDNSKSILNWSAQGYFSRQDHWKVGWIFLYLHPRVIAQAACCFLRTELNEARNH